MHQIFSNHHLGEVPMPINQKRLEFYNFKGEYMKMNVSRGGNNRKNSAESSQN